MSIAKVTVIQGKPGVPATPEVVDIVEQRVLSEHPSSRVPGTIVRRTRVMERVYPSKPAVPAEESRVVIECDEGTAQILALLLGSLAGDPGRSGTDTLWRALGEALPHRRMGSATVDGREVRIVAARTHTWGAAIEIGYEE